MTKFTNNTRVSVATLGSHSALEIARGAHDEGFKTIVVCERGREKTYAKYYKTNDTLGCVDEVIIVDKFQHILKDEVQKQLLAKNAVFVPHRSFEVYINDYDAIEKSFTVPIFGNKFLLRAEERTEKINQYTILKKAGIMYPKSFKNPLEIDRLVIVKAQQKKTSFERGFFFAKNYDEYKFESKKRIDSGFISQKGIGEAIIEEFVVGTAVNFNYFYSPLSQRLELIGTDTRRQTNLDGFLRLPAEQQLEVATYIDLTFKEMGHIAVTLPESLLEDAMEIGEKFLKAANDLFPPGIIGPFALQALVRPAFPKLEIVVYDVSPRVPGSPGITATPYASYLFGSPVSMGRRLAMEIRKGIESDKLNLLLT